MTSTSVRLLDRLKGAPPDASDWGRLHDIYLPLITRWLRRIPGVGDESDDLAQEVFVVMVRELPRFERQREGFFRAWLRQVTVNKVRTWRKHLSRKPAAGLDQTVGFLDHLADPNGELAREWDLDHDRHVFQKLLAIVQPDFQLRSSALRIDQRRSSPNWSRWEPWRCPFPFQLIRRIKLCGPSSRASWI